NILYNFITRVLKLFNPVSNRTYNIILIIIDRFTKYTLYIPIQKIINARQFIFLF
ncbi:hypothetical protein GE21DRAFT_1219047, partial [Neurospora crassa]